MALNHAIIGVTPALVLQSLGFCERMIAMKIIVIGATHAGTFAAQQILTKHPQDQVVVYERNDNLSFLSCGIALWVGDHVSDPNKMFYSNPEALTKLGADMRMQHNVLAVDAETKPSRLRIYKLASTSPTPMTNWCLRQAPRRSYRQFQVSMIRISTIVKIMPTPSV
jgi:ribulose 1,5-bisphosphate synthetase/thiazole synthase